MFTGIIEETGTLLRVRETAESVWMEIETHATSQGLKPGDSLAVNGCCLTAVTVAPSARGATVTFNLLKETWRLTNFQFATPQAELNLERPMRADARFDGHIVTGHVDGLGTLTAWERQERDWLLEIRPPARLLPLLIPKGSIAVDGISLTIAELDSDRFRCWIIPHTYQVTHLRTRHAGDQVNLEADILGKYVQRYMNAFSSQKTAEGSEGSVPKIDTAAPFAKGRKPRKPGQ